MTVRGQPHEKILVLKSSIMGNDSQTNNLIDRYLAERRAKGHEDKIVEHDLTALDLPVLDGELFSAARRGKHQPTRPSGGGAVRSADCRTERERSAADRGANVQLNVPTQLKTGSIWWPAPG